MQTTSSRRVVGLQLDAPDNAPVVFLEGVKGELVALSAPQAASESLALPRWLVMQAGFAAASGISVEHCCEGCRDAVLQALEAKVREWSTPL